MKKKLISQYMKIFVISIFVIIFLWVILTYFFIVSGNDAEIQSPQYLVNSFEHYVKFDRNISIDKSGQIVLNENNLWAQVIDTSGKVYCAYHAPKEAKSCYHVFELSYYAMNSDALGNNTLFIHQFDNHKNYGIIIGCTSKKVSKITLRLTGGSKSAFLQSGIILVIIFLLIGIVAGALFSRSIALPVNEIIEDINQLEEGSELKTRVDRKVFASVFDSLENLKKRLNSVEEERQYIENQRKEWIANISHDMKTPLSSIKGYAELMENNEYLISGEEMHQYAKVITKNADVMTELLDELKFSRLLEDGKIRLNKRQTDICKLLKECEYEIPKEYFRGNISYNFAQKQIYTQVDRELISRCFVNIICNAIIHNTEAVDINIICEKSEKITISIQDNGCGMSDEEQKNIFSRYYRGKKSTQTKGSGLGLAIAKEIVQAHGGEIYVKSIEECGSTFVIILP